MKNKKKKFLKISIIIIILLICIFSILEGKKINNIIKKNKLKSELQDTYEKLQIYDNSDINKMKAVFISKESKEIEAIECPDGRKIECNNKMEIAIDCLVEKNNTYLFRINFVNGEKNEKSFNITDQYIEDTCIKFTNNSEINKEKRITINNNSIMNNGEKIYYKIRKK